MNRLHRSYQRSHCHESCQRKRIHPFQQQLGQNSRLVWYRSLLGGGGAALAGPSSCVDMVPSGRGVPNRAQSLPMAGLSFDQSYLCGPKPRFREFVSNGVILVHKTCLMAPGRAHVRCLTGVRHVRHQTASKASLCGERALKTFFNAWLER